MTNKRRMKKRTGGGFMDSLNGIWDKTKKSSSDLYNSAASATTGAYNSAASATTGAYNSATTAVSGTPTSTTTPTITPTTSGYPSSTMGGRRRRLRGGSLHSYMSRTDLAATAAPFTVKTATPQVIVGGKTRKRRCNNRHHKSCKSRKCKNKHHKTCKRK